METLHFLNYKFQSVRYLNLFFLLKKKFLPSENGNYYFGVKFAGECHLHRMRNLIARNLNVPLEMDQP